MIRSKLSRSAAVVAAVALAGVMTLAGGNVVAKVGGNANGTVKIVEPGGEDALPANDPKVCTFRVAGLGFDADEEVALAIEGQGGPNAGTGTYNNTVSADALGAFQTEVIDLSPGLYKLDADGADSPGAGKHKVFTVECETTDPEDPPDPEDPIEPGGETTTPSVGGIATTTAAAAAATPVQVTPRTTG